MHDTTAPVLITGGSGFLATHIILRLLNEGYRVRTTVRSLHRAPEVRTTLERAGATVLGRAILGPTGSARKVGSREESA